MMYRCPFCGHDFNAVELRQPAGLRGGSYCPKCQALGSQRSNGNPMRKAKLLSKGIHP